MSGDSLLALQFPGLLPTGLASPLLHWPGLLNGDLGSSLETRGERRGVELLCSIGELGDAPRDAGDLPLRVFVSRTGVDGSDGEARGDAPRGVWSLGSTCLLYTSPSPRDS